MFKPLSMRSILVGSFALTGILIVSGIFIAHNMLPRIIHEQTQNALESMGFKEFTLPEPAISGGTALYESIRLDPEGFSEIKSLQIQYGWLRTLMRRKPATIALDGLSLTGELGSNGEISLSGWDTEDIRNLAQGFPAARILVQNSKLSLLSPEIGGISLHMDLQARLKNKNVTFQGHIKSAQKQLNYEAGLSGQINKDGRWQSELDILEAKLEFPHVKASRINGDISFTGDGFHPPQLISAFQVGGANLLGTPWQNLSATLEGTPQNFKIYVGAKSVGIEGLELALNIEGSGNKRAISGAIHAGKLANLFDYLNAQNKLPLERGALTVLDQLSEIDSDFIIEGENLIYRISNSMEHIDIKGKIENYKQDTFSGYFMSSPMFLKQAYPEKGFTNGQITLSGDFTKSEGKISGLVKSDIKDLSGPAGFLTLNAINGVFIIDQLPMLSSDQKQRLSCRLPLRKGLEQHCTLTLKIKQGHIQPEKLEADLLGGHIEALQNKDRQILSLKDIDLKKFLSALGHPEIQGQGKIKGTIPLIRKDGKITIENALISSDGEGTVKLQYGEAMDFLQGDTFEVETTKLALENYHYDTLDIRLNGPLDEPLMVTLNARGRNPDILDSHPVILNIQTKISLKELLGQLLPEDITKDENAP